MNKKEDMQRVSEGLISGFIAPSKEDIEDILTKDDKKDVSNKERTSNKAKNMINTSNNNKLTYDAEKGKYNKNNNYAITFKIDADLTDYLKNIEKITFIESVKSGKIESITRTEFVNKLIREQFYKLIGVSDKDSADTINKKWLEYKDKNNL